MTGMGRDAELVKDQGQAGPRTSGMLNPGGFGAMTAILDVRSQWRGKPSRHNGLTGVCRHRYLQDGKSSRNMTQLRLHVRRENPMTNPRCPVVRLHYRLSSLKTECLRGACVLPVCFEHGIFGR